MLEVRNVTVAYGGLTALREVSLDVRAGALVALVGANGVGKSTLFKAISGAVRLTSGSILYRGDDLGDVATYERARRGIIHVPEGRHVFKGMTVLENIEVGAFAASGGTVTAKTFELIYELFPRLAERSSQLAGTLSGGEQQMLAIARGLAGLPKLLLLDEPSMGLSPALGDEIFDAIRTIRANMEVTIMLVEQRVIEALELCDVGFVLQNGSLVLSGAPSELMKDKRVGAAYVGIEG